MDCTIEILLTAPHTHNYLAWVLRKYHQLYSEMLEG